MPDLNCAQVQDATLKIQSAYRGFKTRKEITKSIIPDSSATESDDGESMPDLDDSDVENATIKIQSAYKGFKTRQMIKKHKEIMPDLNCAQVQDATLKIQSAYRGFKTRKDLKQTGEDLPDLNAAEVVNATIKIQSAYKGFQTRKMIKKHKEVLPDLNCAQVKDATIKIQSAYRGFKTRKELKASGEELPDLNAADVVNATIKIQSAYKGFKTRQKIKEQKEEMPDLKCAKVQDATVKIQSAYRGFKTRQELRKKDDSVSDSSDSSEPESQQKRKDSSDSSATESEDEVKKPTRVNSVKRAQATKSKKETMRHRIPESSATESDAVESMPDTDVDEDEKVYATKPRRRIPDSSATESEAGEDMPDLDDSDVENATIKIQSAYRGFQARKNMGNSKVVPKKQKFEDIVHAAITIQRAFRRYKKKKDETRKSTQSTQQKKLAMKSNKSKQNLSRKSSQLDSKSKKTKPKLAEVVHAAITIQRSYRNYKKRKSDKIMKSAKSTQQKTLGIKSQRSQQDLIKRKKPKPKLADVVHAAITIQRSYRRYKKKKADKRTKLAKSTKEKTSGLKSQRSQQDLIKRKKQKPRLADVVHAAITIQRSYRSYKKRKADKRTKLAKSTQQKTSRLKSQRSQHELTRRPIKTTTTAVRKPPARPKLANVVHAAMTIQRAYRRFKKRKIDRVNLARKQEPTKSVLKSQKSKTELTRRTSKTSQAPVKRQKSKPKFADVVHAAITIQRAYRRYKKIKEENRRRLAKSTKQQKSEIKSQKSKQDIKRQSSKSTMVTRNKSTLKKQQTFSDVVLATRTIQKAYRSYSARKRARQMAVSSDLPDLYSKDVVEATIKIQSAYKGFQTRKSIQKHKEILPDLKCAQVQDATVKIQSAYRGFKTRKQLKENNEDLPDLDAADVVAATIKIQSAFKGFQARKMIKQHKEIMPDLNCAQVQDATVKIQSAYRGFRTRKMVKHQSQDLPDLRAADVVAATIKIQSAYKGFRTRKMIKDHKEIMPDLNCAQVQDATVKIQSAYRGFKTRKDMKDSAIDLPDIRDNDVQEATVKIQAAYRGFQTRKKMKEVEDLPDLNDTELKDAAIKIQSAYKGFQVRKENRERKLLEAEIDELPDLCDQETLAAALKIQSAFKGYQVRKVNSKVPLAPQPSIDFDNMPPSDFSGMPAKSTRAKRVPPVPKRFDSNVMQTATKSTSSDVPNDFGVKETPKSPLPARSSRLKEVAIPTVPPYSNEHMSVHSKQELPSSTSTNISELENKTETSGFLSRKESLQSFFKKQSDATSPITPPPPQPTEEKERGRKESLTRAFREAGETIRSRSKSKEKQKKDLSLPQKEKDEQTKSKIGGFFSSMFKSKSKQKPTTPTDAISPDMKAMSNVEFKFDEPGQFKSQDNLKKIGEKNQKPTLKPDLREELIKSTSPKANSSDADSRRSDSLSQGCSKDDEITLDTAGSKQKLNKTPQPSKSEVKAIRRMSQESKESVSKAAGSSTNGTTTRSRQAVSPDNRVTTFQTDLDDPNLKKDLIHVVLSAVEENWLNQAPKPTLDKVAALQALDSDPELENSERSTSEADYVKKKMKAQKSEDLNSDDEGARLCKQESAEGDLPYVETTLPQERPGIVTITPSSQRLSQCKLTSTERPRSSSPRKPGNLSQYVKSKETADHTKEPLTVKLPRQESKTKLKAKTAANQQSWDKFSAAGLQSPKQVRKTSQPKPERKKREPPKSVHISRDSSPGKPDWIDCDSLPEKKRQPKKYESTELSKSPTDTGRAGLHTPTGTQIVSPEECSCDCHHESPPHTLTRNVSQISRGVLRSSMTAASTSSSGSSSRPVPCAASRKKESPPTYKKVEVSNKGAVPKSTRRPGGPPTPPIRTSSAVKSPKPSSGSREVLTRNTGEISNTHSRATRTKSEQSEKVVRRVTQEGRAVRRRDEAKRESLTKRSSTISSDD